MFMSKSRKNSCLLFNSASFILPVITKEIEMELTPTIDASKQNEDENEHQQQQVQKVSDTFKKTIS